MRLRAAADWTPVEPNAETARRWATEELARGAYTERTGLLDRFVTWLLERLDQLAELSTGSTGWVAPTAIVVVAALVVVVAVVVGPPVRRRRAPATRDGVLDAEERAAAQLRAAADRAAAAGDYSNAVTHRFRAIVRTLADRSLLEERPGLTAHEAATEAALRLPALEADLIRAGLLFDRVRYGHAPADAGDARWMEALDETASSARPSARAPAGDPS